MKTDFKITQEFIESRPLSASSLKAFRKSPKHYLQYLNKPFEASDAMNLGSLVDVLTLTPEKFDKRFYVFQKATGTGSRAINEDAKRKAKEKRVTLITSEQVKIAKICVESLYSNRMSRELIEAKKNVQKQLKWRNNTNNLPLIGYQDFESMAWGDHFIVDLKTAKSADPDKFNRDAANFDYEIQVGAYLDAHHRLYYKFPNFIFLVVETIEPFNVSINFCDEEYINRAKSEFLNTLKAFRYAMENYPTFNKGYEFVKSDNYSIMKIPAYKKMIYEEFDIKNELT